MPTYRVVPTAAHNDLVRAAYLKRGFTADEAEDAARFCEMASAHGIRTHNAIKALHLDELFGSMTGGCTPGAEVEVIEKRFAASEVWDAHLKLGQSVAFRAMERCMELADQYGIGQVSVDNAFHYLWGGGYVMDAARKGYLAYTNCTSTLAEVVPFGGKFPVLGTNPHSWGLPTIEACGFPIVIDWATSTVAMGRVQQFRRENQPLPAGAAVDAEGRPTTDANAAQWLLPFGAHKGYGLSLLIEVMGGLIGGSLPTLRGGGAHPDIKSTPPPAGEKRTSSFYFQVIHPDAIGSGRFAQGRDQAANVKAVIDDILSHGNEGCMLPGQPEARNFEQTTAAGGLLFTEAEVHALNEIAEEAGKPSFDAAALPVWEVA
ncbi:MAG: Ldh family oxidoreductase [Verrucomicrobiales bacterium]|nr:Ldh family oxidoreductase [Verrucomicrobiales bacterium]